MTFTCSTSWRNNLSSKVEDHKNEKRGLHGLLVYRHSPSSSFHPSTNSSSSAQCSDSQKIPLANTGLPFAPKRLLISSLWRKKRDERQVIKEEVHKKTWCIRHNECHAWTNRPNYISHFARFLTISLILIANNTEEIFRLLISRITLSYYFFFCLFRTY